MTDTINETIKKIIAGQCDKCGQGRIAQKNHEGGVGFGSIRKIVTVYVCDNSQCDNHGKP